MAALLLKAGWKELEKRAGAGHAHSHDAHSHDAQPPPSPETQWYPQGPTKGASLFIAPLPTPLGVDYNSCYAHPTTLVFEEFRHAHLGGNFLVKDINGADVLRTEGKYDSLTDKRRVLTPHGLHVMTIRKNPISYPKSFKIEGADGKEVVHLKNKHASGITDMDVTFSNKAADGAPVLLELQGSCGDSQADIIWNRKVVAKIYQSFSVEVTANGDGRYEVEIAPGADVILFAAIVIALDLSIMERHHQA